MSGPWDTYLEVAQDGYLWLGFSKLTIDNDESAETYVETLFKMRDMLAEVGMALTPRTVWVCMVAQLERRFKIFTPTETREVTNEKGRHDFTEEDLQRLTKRLLWEISMMEPQPSRS